MNHLEYSFTGKNSFWRYIVMVAAVLIASNTIGAIPLLTAYAVKAAADPSVVSRIAGNPDVTGILGLNPNLGLFMMLFPFLAALVAFILLIKPLNKRTFKMTVNGSGPVRWNRFFMSGFIWLVLSAAYLFIYLKADPSNFILSNTSSTLIGLTVVSLVFIPFQAAFEEVVFRGYLMQGFAALSGNRWFPVLITSVLFGVMHSFNPEVGEFGFLTMMPQYILFGLLFGIIAVMDDGIEAAVGAHAANNIFLCIMVTNDSSALQTDAVYRQANIYPWTEMAALLITGVVFIYILRILFRWGNFSRLISGVEPPDQQDHNGYTGVLSELR